MLITTVRYSVETFYRHMGPYGFFHAAFRPVFLCLTWRSRGGKSRHSCFLHPILDHQCHHSDSFRRNLRNQWLPRNHAKRWTLEHSFRRPCHWINGATWITKTVSRFLTQLTVLHYFRLCCCPVQLKSKYYPWVLIIIFSLLFGLQIDFWCGLAVGYMWHYGLFSKCMIGVGKATAWE